MRHLIQKYTLFLVQGLAMTLILSQQAYSQVPTHSQKFCSNLPIVIATLAKDNKSFPIVHRDTPEEMEDSKAKREVMLTIFDNNPTDALNGEINCIADNSENIDATMHYRGSSSLDFPKHQFGVKLSTPWKPKSNPSLKTENFLGMPYGGKSWIFSAEQANLDGTYLRNTLSFHLQNEFGKLMQTNKAWGPRTRFFELFLNQGYKLYVLPVLPGEADQSYMNAFIYIEGQANPTLYYRHADSGKTQLDVIKIDNIDQFKQAILKPMEFYKDGNLVRKYTERYLTEKEIKQFVSSSYTPPKKELDIKNDYAGLYVVAEAIQFSDSRVNPDPNSPSLLYKIDQPSAKACEIPVFDSVTNQTFVVYDEQGIKLVGNDKCKQTLPDFWPNAFSLWSKSVKSLQPTQETITINGRPQIALIQTDEDSFAISFLLNEFIKDPDGYNRNTYFYQSLTKGVPVDNLTMFAGPLWDKNLGYDLHLPPADFPGTGGYMPPDDSIYKGTTGWTFNVKHDFWKDVFKRPSVQGKICQYWSKAKANNILTDSAMTQFLNQKTDWIKKSGGMKNTPIERDCDRYFPNTECAKQYQAKVKLLTDYINGRLQWMNNQLGNTEKECQENMKRIFGDTKK